MARLLRNKTTLGIREIQSHAPKGALLKNISINGGDPLEWEEVETDLATAMQMLENGPTKPPKPAPPTSITELVQALSKKDSGNPASWNAIKAREASNTLKL